MVGSAGRRREAEKPGSGSSCSNWLPGERKSTQLQLVVKSVCRSSSGRVGGAELWPPEAASGERGGALLLEKS